MQEVLLVRYGEIGLKGDNRSQFEEALARNIRFAVRSHAEARVGRTHGRIYVSEVNDADEAARKISRIPGVVAVGQAIRVPADIDFMRGAAVLICRKVVSDKPSLKTFKVRTRRSDKSFPMTSPQISSELGGVIFQAIPDLDVDVHEPSFILDVEVREEGVYLYAGEIPGPGGLPLGTGGKALLLLSGGIDSPVAGYMAMKRGISVDALHFWSYPITGERSKEKVVRLCQVLQEYNPRMRLHIAHFTAIQTAILEKCPEKFRVTIMRRMMMRVASRLAEKTGALAVFTGENVGQVASQTLESLAAIEDAATVPVLRPLICFNKVETIDIAKHIGTYDLSILPFEDCCTVFVPRHPVIKPRTDEVRAAESALDVEALVSECVERVEEVTL